MYKTELQKAQDILHSTTDPADIEMELDMALGSGIVTMLRGMSTHVGVLRRHLMDHRVYIWEVAYNIGRYTVPVTIPFDTARVEQLSWDTVYDRPSICVRPF